MHGLDGRGDKSIVKYLLRRCCFSVGVVWSRTHGIEMEWGMNMDMGLSRRVYRLVMYVDGRVHHCFGGLVYIIGETRGKEEQGLRSNER